MTGFLLMYAVRVLLMKGHGAGVTTEKSMRTDFFFLRLDPQIFPPFLPFSSSFLCIFTARLFGSRSFGLGGVVPSRQCGKMSFLKAKLLRFFRTLEASTVLPIHAGLLIFIPHTVCVPMYSKGIKPLHMLRYTSV